MSDRRTLYVYRPVRNPDDLISWAKANGFETVLPEDDLHVTVAFSKSKLDWGYLEPANNRITNHLLAGRIVKPLGDKGAVVLAFHSQSLSKRWRYFRDAGASWDWPGYQPHVTITYEAKFVQGFRLGDVKPYAGPIVLGAERFAEVNEDWTDTVTEKSQIHA